MLSPRGRPIGRRCLRPDSSSSSSQRAASSSSSLRPAVAWARAIGAILLLLSCLLATGQANQLPAGGRQTASLSRVPSLDQNGLHPIELQRAQGHQRQRPPQQVAPVARQVPAAASVLGRTVQKSSSKRRRTREVSAQQNSIKVGQVMQLNDNGQGAGNNLKAGPRGRRANLLVDQLSDLIMNNEAETIRQKLADVQISGQLRVETDRLAAASKTKNGLSRADTPLLFGLKEGAASQEDIDVDYDAFDEDDEDEDEDEDDEDKKDEDDDDFDDNDADQLNAIVGKTPERRPSAERGLKRRHTAEVKPEEGKSSPWWPWKWLESSGPSEPVTTTTISPADEQAQANSQSGDQLDMSEQNTMVTCPTNLEDMATLEANLSALLQSGGSSGEIGNGSFSPEQRQNLFNSPDLATVFNTTGLSASQHQMALQIQHQLQQQAACFQSGPSFVPSETIIFITKFVTPAVFSFIIVVGLLGNIIVVFVLWEDARGEWSPTNLLILDLSIADLSFIIFCIPFTGWDYAVGHWVFGPIWCKANQYLIVVCALSSIWTLVLMSCDRYMAIVHPIKCINYRTSRNMGWAIVIKWVAILVLALPTIPMHGLIRLDEGQQDEEQFSCRFLPETYNPVRFQIIFFITSYFLPLVLIFVLYLGLLRRLWNREKPRGHKESTKALESKKKITRMVACIVIFFAGCWCPIQVMLILMRVKTFEITATYVAVQVFAHTLGYMNSCVNPFIYAFTTDTFYKSFKRSRFGRLCLSLLCCRANSGQDQGQSLAHSQLNNAHNTNGLNASFGHHQRGGSTLVVLGSGGAVRDCNQQARAARNSLQFVSTTTTTTRTTTATVASGDQSTSATLDAPLTNQRANKSMGNIFVGSPAPTSKFQAPSSSQSRCDSLEHSLTRPRSQLALEPRDRPQQPSKAQTSQTASINNLVRQQQQQQQLQSPILPSSSVSQLSKQQCATTTKTTTTNGQQQRKKATSTSELVPRQPTASAKVFQSLEQHQQRRQAAEAKAIAAEAAANECEAKEGPHLNGQICPDSSGQLADDGSCKWCCDSLGSNASNQTADFDQDELD